MRKLKTNQPTPTPGESTTSAPPTAATPAPAPAPATTPAPAAGKTKVQRLLELSDAYRAEKISAAQYHQERARIISEP